MITIRKQHTEYARHYINVTVLDTENEIGFEIDVTYDIINGGIDLYFVTTTESFSQILPMILPIPDDISKIYIGDFCYFENDTGIHRFNTMPEIIEKISSLT